MAGWKMDHRNQCVSLFFLIKAPLKGDFPASHVWLSKGSKGYISLPQLPTTGQLGGVLQWPIANWHSGPSILQPGCIESADRQDIQTCGSSEQVVSLAVETPLAVTLKNHVHSHVRFALHSCLSISIDSSGRNTREKNNVHILTCLPVSVANQS